MKLSGLVLAVFALVAVFGVSESRKDKCALDCPNDPNFKTYWASDLRTTCTPFQNKCFMDRENCKRSLNNQKLLIKVSERTCKTYCKNMCTFQVQPVCGELNGDYKLFTSECAMENDICLSGKPYTITRPDKCGLYAFIQTTDY